VTVESYRARYALIFIAVTALLVIVARIILLIPFQPPFLVQLIEKTQTINLGLSLLTNIIATAVIAIKTWQAPCSDLPSLLLTLKRALRRKYRAEVFALDAQKQTPVLRILLLFVESGAIYCASSVRTTAPSLYMPMS
jgi:hypothetical protein